MRDALRKLVRALPETMRTEAETASRSVWSTPAAGDERRDRLADPTISTSCRPRRPRQAQMRIGYRDRNGATTSRVVDPLGLAQKGRVWYLIAGTDKGQRTFRIARVTSVERTGRPVARPPGFDLAESWRDVVDRVDHLRSPIEIELLVREPHVQTLRWIFDDQAIVGAATDRRQDRGAASAVQHVDVLAAQVAGFGRDVEVVGPAEARQLLAEFAGELREVYDEQVVRMPVDG